MGKSASSTPRSGCESLAVSMTWERFERNSCHRHRQIQVQKAEVEAFKTCEGLKVLVSLREAMRPIRGSPRSIRSSGAAAEGSGGGSGRKEGRRSTRPSWSIWLFDTDEFDAGRPKPKTALWCDKSSFKTRGQHPFPFKQFCTPFFAKNTPLHNADQAHVPKRSSSRAAI